MRVHWWNPIGYVDLGVKNIQANLVGEITFPQGWTNCQVIETCSHRNRRFEFGSMLNNCSPECQ